MNFYATADIVERVVKILKRVIQSSSISGSAMKKLMVANNAEVEKNQLESIQVNKIWLNIQQDCVYILVVINT